MTELGELPRLQSFPAVSQPEPERFGVALTDASVRGVELYCESCCQETADSYTRMLGIDSKTNMNVVGCGSLPYDEIAEIRSQGIVPLFVDRAINPDLKNRFFQHPNVIGFADHHYARHPGRNSSLALNTIGTTEHGLYGLPNMSQSRLRDLRIERSARMKKLLGEKAMTYVDFRNVLKSNLVRKIRMHALGPAGTNISQAAEKYLRTLRVFEKSEVIVHENGVEPMQYAETAAQEVRAGTIPLHMECAVYYQMGDLFDQRGDECVFADHQYMLLDEMQLARRSDHTLNGHMINVSSHPSPVDLVSPWIQADRAVYLKASSNSAAAEAVKDESADVCITTESARMRHQLTKLHSFGSPMMIFTVGTSLSMQELQRFYTE